MILKIYNIILFFSYPIIPIFKLISYFKKIKIGNMTPYRIGHLVGELSLWHLEQKDLEKNFFCIWYIPKKNCNNFFIKKISKKINISSFFLLKILHDLFLKFNQKDFLISGPTHGERDINCLISRNQNLINFSQEEVKRGDELLEKLGINKMDQFVCLCIRDNFFFKNFVPNYAWEEAQFKNSNIENYNQAIEYLNTKKIKVIRMGHGSEKSWGLEDDLNIDYSRNKLRSGFLDFYLVHKSKFVIMNGTGFYWIPYILKKPILMADFIPIGKICTYIPNSIHLFKHIYSKKNKRNLDLESLLSADKSFIYRNTEFEKKNLKAIDNSPVEILKGVEEIYNRINGSWNESESENVRQINFWKKYQKEIKNANNRQWHNIINTKVGSNFLKNYI